MGANATSIQDNGFFTDNLPIHASFEQAANWASMDEMNIRITPYLYAEYS